MDKPWQVINDLELHSSRLNKEAIILVQAQANNDEFFRGCRWALDSMITFGVKKVEEKSGDGRGITPKAFWDLAEKLSRREVTGNAALTAINYLRMNAREKEWNQWYRRILIKDLRCGVSEKTINNVVEKINSNYMVPVFSCQLASDSAHHENLLSGKKIVEVKLDGVRVITIVYPNGNVDQYSRNGKELVNFPVIKEQFARHARLLKEPMVFDGEVMSSSFQDLMKQIHRKSDANADDAVLNLFDMLTLDAFNTGRSDVSQLDRSLALNIWFGPIADHMPNVTIVGQEMIDLDTQQGQKRFKMINTQAVAGGYEGIMIKDPSAGYECKRGRTWLKLKPFIEVSLTVVELEEGTGKNAGRLGALICEGVDDGDVIRVNVGSGLTDALREEIWDDPSLVVGQVVEIRADAKTQSQDSENVYSLRFPRFLRFRGFSAGEKL